MKVLHYDLGEEPKKEDKAFKARNPSPTRWQVLGNTHVNAYRPLMGSPLQENHVSSDQEARMACTALQNLLYEWQQGGLS